MKGTVIGENTVIDKAIIAENCQIGDGAVLGLGEEKENRYKPEVYTGGLVTIGEESTIPAGVKIGKNTAISGITEAADYPEGILESGESIIKDGDEA